MNQHKIILSHYKKNRSSFSTSTASSLNFPSFDNSNYVSSQSENAELFENQDTAKSVGKITETSTGCSLRVDYNLHKVFVQTKKVQDGLEVQSCQDTNISFDLKKDYESCSTQNMFTYYYLDQNQIKSNVGSCVYDDTIVETVTGCSARIDYTQNKVFVQTRKLQKGSQVESCSDSATYYLLKKDYDSCQTPNKFLYYYLDSGQKVNNVGSCVYDDTIVETEQGCNLRFDYTLNKVFVQTKKTQSGITIQSCQDTTTSFDIEMDYNHCTAVNQFLYYYLDSRDQSRHNIGSCVYDDSIIESTEGCNPTIDYTLNKVFVQTKKLQAGIVIQSCQNSTTSFDLKKDYNICPNQEDLVNLKHIVNFQYYYEDEQGLRNNIADCQEDESQRSDIVINKDYASCDKHIDLPNLKIYDQYKETYNNQSGTTIVKSDCQIDYTNSYTLVEDFTSCSLNNNFAQSFSTRKRNIGYTNSEGQYQEIYSCLEDTSTTYPHQLTQDTCSPVTSGGLTQLFQRKYVEISAVRTYISECEAFGNQIAVQEENCVSTPYAHEISNSKSYKNISTYYISGGSKIYISNCVKSSTSFNHQLDTSVCSSTNNDTTKKTDIFSRTFFIDNGNKIYVTDSCQKTSEINYTQIGHIWQNIFTNQTKSISVTNSGDQTLLGKKHGDEVPKPEEINYGISCGTDQTHRINLYDISSYSTTGKCQSYTNPTYNGVAIDSSLSNLSTITFDNYVQNVPIPDGTYKWRQSCPNGSLIIRSMSGDNFAYYQRCTNYSCPLTQVKRYPIYRRGDNSQYTDSSIVLEEKYLCGNSNLLHNQQTIY